MPKKKSIHDELGTSVRPCAICGKDIFLWASSEYVYKRYQKGGTAYFCSYSHMREWERAHPSTIDKKLKEMPGVVEKNKDDDKSKKYQYFNIYEFTPTDCQWTRFHDRWINSNIHLSKNIKYMHELFNKKFLLNISLEEFKNRIKYLEGEEDA